MLTRLEVGMPQNVTGVMVYLISIIYRMYPVHNISTLQTGQNSVVV